MNTLIFLVIMSQRSAPNIAQRHKKFKDFGLGFVNIEAKCLLHSWLPIRATGNYTTRQFPFGGLGEITWMQFSSSSFTPTLRMMITHDPVRPFS